MVNTACNSAQRAHGQREHRQTQPTADWHVAIVLILATAAAANPNNGRDERAPHQADSTRAQSSLVTDAAPQPASMPPLQVYGRAFLVYSRLCERPDTSAGDTRLRHVLDSILRFDPIVDHHRVHADVCRGTAYLSGTVSGRAQIRRAQELAERLDGIADVENSIRVARGIGSVAGDGVVEQRIYRHLKEDWTPRAAAKVQVSVTGGVATLRGRVPDSEHYADIVGAALSAGAEAVRCRLDLATAPERGYGPQQADTTGAPVPWP